MQKNIRADYGYIRPMGRIISGDFKSIYLSEYSISRTLEGKLGIDIHSPHWRKCRPCLEYGRNLYVDDLMHR